MWRAIGHYLADMREKNLCQAYIVMTRGRLNDFALWMEDRGVICCSKVDTKLLAEYMETYRCNAASYQSYCWNVIRGFLRFHEHPLANKFRWKAQGRDRQVKWLTEDQMDFLLSSPLSPREALMVTAGLLGMLRRIEVLRLKVADLLVAQETGTLSVWAKGKVRSVPVHPDFRMAIAVYLNSVDLGPGNKALPFGQDNYCKVLRDLEARVGIPCQAHTLRRTGLRLLNKRGVPLATISAIAGHSNPETTMRYIGQPIDDMRKAIWEIGPKPVCIERATRVGLDV